MSSHAEFKAGRRTFLRGGLAASALLVTTSPSAMAGAFNAQRRFAPSGLAIGSFAKLWASGLIATLVSKLRPSEWAKNF